MLFAIGTRVRLKNTGDEGIVIELLSDGIAMIRLYADDMEIPIPVENLIRAEDRKEGLKGSTPVKASIVPGKQKKKPFRPDRPNAASQYSILKSKGIQLAFAPVLNNDGSTNKFEIHLINDTRYDVIFSFELSLAEVAKIRINGKSTSISATPIGDLLFDQLNENPLVRLTCHQITTQGTGPKFEKELKIKAKQFFNKKLTAPILNKIVHLYRIFENFDAPPQKNTEEDLKTYTKDNIKSGDNDSNFIKLFPSIDLNEIANFSREIDLHIENLVDNHRKMSNAAILETQLKHCQNFIDKAVRLNASPVFIIHGLGEGTLRNRIADLLRTHPDVRKFKNEYHPKYGNGATEVIL